jgi:hypothetical protein
MQTVYKDTQEATNKWWAAKDAAQRSRLNKTLWARAVQLKVERMQVVLAELYAGRAYEDYGKRTAGVKVNGTLVRDAQALRSMEAAWAEEGIVKQLTKTGVAYKVA